MSSLRVHFLGVPEIILDNTPIHLQRRHSIALLAYLILTRRVHSRDELATFLSGDEPEDAARKRLRNALADLSSSGLGTFLLVNRNSVEFDRDASADIDVWALDAMIAPGGSPSAADLEWAEARCALELLSGISLPEAAQFEMWLVAERESRHQQLVRLAYQRLQQLFWNGQIESGIEVARRLLSIEPWHEGAHRHLMQLLARNDELAAALAQYDRCKLILHDELGVEPQPETIELYEKLRRGPVPVPNNLNIAAEALEPLLGRKVEMETAIQNLTDPACRLLTIAGMGGVGKTSLATAIAAQMASPASIDVDHPFADGVFLVDLANTHESDDSGGPTSAGHEEFVTAIGHALGLVFYGRIDRLEQIVAYIASKRILIVLDNMELYQQEATALRRILRQTPHVTILTTSLVPLNIAEEWMLWVGGLAMPAVADELEQYPASQLFLREARRAGGRVEPDQRESVVGICSLVGGLPLALEVVAAWSAVMSCAEIESELARSGVLLRMSPPNAAEDGGSVEKVVTATCESLMPDDRDALLQLAIFPGHFSIASTVAVGVATERLMTLAQRRLIEHRPDDRFMMHPLVRNYALTEISADPAREIQLRDSHAAHYAAFIASQMSRLSQDPDVREVLDAERANIAAAWSWAVERGSLILIEEMLQGLATWNELIGSHRRWANELSTAIEKVSSGPSNPHRDRVLVRLLAASAEAMLWQGALDRAFPLIAEAHRLSEALDMIELEAIVSGCEGRLLRFADGRSTSVVDALHQARVLARASHQPHIEAESLLQLSFASIDHENYREAESYLVRAEMAFQAVADRLDLCRVVQSRGRVEVLLGRFLDAGIHLEQSLHMARQFGNRFIEGYSHLYLGIVHDCGLGLHRQADEHFERTAEILRQTGDPYLDGNLHRAVGRNALHSGDFARASQSFEYALASARDVNSSRAINDSLRCLAHYACESGDLDIALSLAQQAQRLSFDQGRRHAAASVQFIMGLAHERLGLRNDAELNYAQAFSTASELDITHLVADAAAGIASMALARGDIDLALKRVETVLAFLHEHALAGCEEPGRIVRICFDVLQAAGDSRARNVQTVGLAQIERRLLALPQNQRRRYVASYKDRVDIVQQWGSAEGRLAEPLRLSDFQRTVVHEPATPRHTNPDAIESLHETQRS